MTMLLTLGVVFNLGVVENLMIGSLVWLQQSDKNNGLSFGVSQIQVSSLGMITEILKNFIWKSPLEIQSMVIMFLALVVMTVKLLLLLLVEKLHILILGIQHRSKQPIQLLT